MPLTEMVWLLERLAPNQEEFMFIREHSRPNFFVIVKREYIIGKAHAFEDFV